MTSYSVTGTATRLVRETIEFSVDVDAASLAGIEAAVSAALASGYFEVEDTSEADTVGVATLTKLVSVENLGDISVEQPAAAYSPAALPADTGYTPAARGQEGFAVADVQPRPNGYVPVRVAHRAAR